MNKKQRLMLVIVSNIASIIPLTFFILSIIESISNKGTLYYKLGFISLIYIVINVGMNVMLITEIKIKEETI